jgi:hypothetical protein
MIKFRFFGDFLEASKLVHIARKQMNILKQSMEVSGLWTEVRKWSSEVTGAKITCWSIGGRDYADIFYPPTVVVVKPEKVVLEEEGQTLIAVILGTYNSYDYDAPYDSSRFSGLVYLVWDIVNEEIVEGPVPVGQGDYADSTFRIATDDIFYKALICGADNDYGNAMAYIDASRITPSELICNLYIPTTYVNYGLASGTYEKEFSRSSSVENYLGTDDTCTSYTYMKNDRTVCAGLADCDAGRNIFFNTGYIYTRKDYRDCDIKVTGYGMPSPHGQLNWDAPDDYILANEQHAITIPANSLVFGNGSTVIASVRIDFDYDFVADVCEMNCCDGGFHSVQTVTEAPSVSKWFATTTPIGVLWKETELDVASGSLVFSRDITCGGVDTKDWTGEVSCKDIGFYNFICEAVTANTGRTSNKIEFYFSQYNVRELIIDDPSYYGLTTPCGEQSTLYNKYDWEDLADYNEWTDRQYDVLAGVDGVKNGALTLAFKSLIDYYYANALYDGEPVSDSFVEKTLDINIALVNS